MAVEIYSDYYGQLFVLTREQQEFVLSSYLEICRQQQWVPEVTSIDAMMSDEFVFNHVMYHIEEYMPLKFKELTESQNDNCEFCEDDCEE